METVWSDELENTLNKIDEINHNEWILYFQAGWNPPNNMNYNHSVSLRYFYIKEVILFRYYIILL